MKRTTRKDYSDRTSVPSARGYPRRQYSTNDIDQFFNTNIDKNTRTLYIGTMNFSSEGVDLGVESLMAEYVIKGIHVLNQASSKPIRAILNTAGGSTFDGFAIYDAICSSKAPIDIEVYGMAASMGSIILQAGRERLIHPNALIMVHDGYTCDKERIPMRSQEAWMKWSKEDRFRMYELFAERSGKSVRFWEKRCGHDFIATARESVRFGLADRILEYASWRRQISKINHNGKH